MMRARRLVLLVLLAEIAACSDVPGGATRQERVLSTQMPPGFVPVGDVAGPADRGAELIVNPFAMDPTAQRDGGLMFRSMNCAYCHGGTGEGGMGPNLVDGEWLFGNTSADRFMSVYGGRARGMPAYGGLLPNESLWKLVAYVEHLGRRSGEPDRAAGRAQDETRESRSTGVTH